jgi:hypothetical protein
MKDRLTIEDFEIFIKGLVVENRLSPAVAELYVLFKMGTHTYLFCVFLIPS